MTDLKKGQNGSWQNEGYKLCYVCGAPDVKKAGADHGVLMIGRHAVFALDKSGKYVGHAEFGDDGKVLFPTDTKVKEEHRRKGLATAMYKLAEEKAKKVIDKSYVQSADAKALWAQKNRPFGKSVEEIEKLEKVISANNTHYPEESDPDGHPHPEKPHLEKKTGKNGKPVWTLKSNLVSGEDQNVKAHYLNYVKKSGIGPSTKKMISNLMDLVLSDQDRHVVAGQTDPKNTNGNPELRLRHLKGVFSGADGYKIKESGGGIQIHAQRHSGSSKTSNGIDVWSFDQNGLKFLRTDPIDTIRGVRRDEINKRTTSSGGQQSKDGGGTGGTPVVHGQSIHGAGKEGIQKISEGVVKRKKAQKSLKEGLKRSVAGTSLVKLLQRLRKDGLPGGKGDDKPDGSFDPKELKMGITVESEHTSDPNVAKEVAKDHLTENPKYYSKLKDSGLADELKKAVHHKDMTRIQNKTDSSGDSVVDTTEHSKIKPDHQYTSMLNSPNVHKGEGIRQFGGISAKMVHKIKRSGVPGDEDTYMAKPYHKKIESATRSWIKNPILGWSTMATRNLMHAAGMGENTENVSVHTHNGVPLTVHKFDKNVKPINENLEYGSFHGTLRGADDNTAIQAKKIAIMDFLTGNLDRHYGNMMYDQSNKKLLAIDHERSFQYAKPHDKGESPLSYLAGSSLNTAVRNKNTPYDHADELADWWNSSKDNIKTALDKELAHIQDPHITDHIEQNLNKRHEQLSDFFQHDPWSVFTNNFPNVDLYSKKLPKQDINAIVSNMPHEDKQAVRYIDNVLSKKKGSATASTLLDLWKISLGRMSPSDIADYYHSNPYHHLANHEHGATYGLLTHLSETGNKKAMDELLKRGGLPPFWEDRFKEEVKK